MTKIYNQLQGRWLPGVIIASGLMGLIYWQLSAQGPAPVELPAQASHRASAVVEMLHRNQGEVKRYETEDGFLGQLKMPAREELELGVRLTKGWQIGEPVEVEAPHGGVLNRENKPLYWVPHSAGQELRFEYQLGVTPGKYVVTIRQGQRQETVEFWVGEQKPAGEPGPVLQFEGK